MPLRVYFYQADAVGKAKGVQWYGQHLEITFALANRRLVEVPQSCFEGGNLYANNLCHIGPGKIQQRDVLVVEVLDIPCEQCESFRYGLESNHSPGRALH